MNTISSTSDTSRFSGNDYGWPDFLITLIVAGLGAGMVFATNSVPGLYGPHIGLVLSFVALMWIGFGFAQMPARWWGDLIMIGATLTSFFSAIQSRFQADWVIALLFTVLGSTSLFWGFSEGMRRLNDSERQKLNREMSDVWATLLFSGIGGLVLCGAARVPYAGIFLASLLAILCGAGLGYVELPVWSRIVVTVFSVIGFFFGLKWQLEPSFASDTRVILGTFIGLCTFYLGFLRGLRRAKREDERDECDSDEDNEHGQL